MSQQPSRTVRIAPSTGQAPLTAAQKRFNTLIRQIGQKRERLAAWEAAVPPYQAKYTRELLPLADAMDALQGELVLALDRASEHTALSKTDRRTVAELIAGLARDLLESRDDADLKAIYNKHSRSDYDREEADELANMKLAMEAMLGIDLGDAIDAASPDELLRHAQAQLDERWAQRDAAREARDARRARRKKSDKQQAREAQQAAAEKQVSQSIREVYRKLASALHPDRETDPQEKARKTALMQRANEAYGKNNLLQLLELQLELEHINQSAIDDLGDERLTHYNAVLKGQLGELEREILEVEGRFRAQFGIAPFVPVAPTTVLRDLGREIVAAQQAMVDMRRDVQMVGEVKTLKLWLKEMKRQQRASALDDALPF